MAGRGGRTGVLVSPEERDDFLRKLEEHSDASSLSDISLPPLPRRARTTTRRTTKKRSNHKHEDGCRVCGKDNDHRSLMICEKCDNEYHYYCLDPPLKSVPRGDWYCDTCKPSAETADGLDALVSALPPRFTERFGEIVWAQGGVGFGWWPACVYDPRMTVGGARDLARKNLAKKHLVYFFECNQAPFSVLTDSKLSEWTKGLSEDFHLGKAAHAYGKGRGMQFRQALHIACLEEAKPIDMRIVWNHGDDDESPHVDEGPELPLSPNPRRRAPRKKRRRRSPKVRQPLFIERSTESENTNREAQYPPTPTRTNLMRAIAVHERPKQPDAASRSLFCRVMKRNENGEDWPLGFITLGSITATFEDARDEIIAEMDDDCLPAHWKFFLPSLGPVSKKQEERLGAVADFIKQNFGRDCGDGTAVNPLRLTIVPAPKTG